MAKFLTTSGTAHSIEEIIRKAGKTLTLVTPYLQISNILQDRLRDADREGVKMTIIYGKEKLDYKQEQILNSLENLEVYYYEHLHAKCYFNEKLMVISSMNLYSYSEKNNREMGILIDPSLDQEIYSDALKEVESIKKSAQPLRGGEKKETAHQSFQKDSVSNNWETSKGYSNNNDRKVANYQNNNGKAVSSGQPMDIKPELNYKFDQKHNFHLPTLFKSLKVLFPYAKIYQIDQDNTNYIFIQDFPVYGINVEITGRIDVLFLNDKLAKKVMYGAKNKLERKMPDIRFYWNYDKLNIYTEKDFDPEVSIDGVVSKVNKFLQIIKYSADILKVEAV